MPDLSSLCLAQYAPLDNVKDQNPCVVARILTDACAKGSDVPRYFPIYPLAIDQDEDHYDPPSSAQQSPCLCSMPVYNLLQACAACQHPGGSSSTLWSYFVADCSAKPLSFPAPVPYNTVIPSWAMVDSSQSSTDVRQVMRQLTSNYPPTDSSSSKASSSASTSATSASSPAANTAMPAKGDAPPPPEHSLATSTKIVLALVAVFAAALLAALALYVQKKRRARRQGRRLGSISDTTDDMSQKRDMSSSFLPSESFLSRDTRASFTGDSRTSFATNSVSTHPRYHRNSLAPTSILYTTTSRSSDFTLDRDSFDDDSISPFSDVHQPPHARVATRDNLHSRADSISTFSRSSFTDSRRTTDDLSMLSSLRSPPSSTGATYGRGHDDEDLISLGSASTRRSN